MNKNRLKIQPYKVNYEWMSLLSILTITAKKSTINFQYRHKNHPLINKLLDDYSLTVIRAW